MPNGVLVFGEATDEGALSPVTAELIAVGTRLGGPVTCVLPGSGVEGIAQKCVEAGAGKVIVVDDPLLAPYQGDAYIPMAERITKETDPAAVLMGQTLMGRDLAPRLAQRLGTAAAMDCVNVTLDGDKLIAERPCYGGSAMAKYKITGSPGIATLRAKAQEPLAPDSSRSGEIVKEEAGVSADQVRTKIVDRRKEKAEGVRLEDAPVVVSGGRGLGGPEAFKDLEELADILGGAVGASRAVCDLGWYPVPNQVGLTGKVVTPDLYIAIAISGASQHMAGISSVKNIVSINKDEDANIFKSSRFGVVGDWKEVLPAFTKKVQELRSA